jgi:L-cystine transport system substrate-binding protein
MSGWKSLLDTFAALSLVACTAYSSTQVSAQNALEKVKSAGELRIGWAEWRPMEYRDAASGELKGFLIAFAEDLAKRMGVKPVFVEDNWSTLTAGLAADKFQISLMGTSDARKRVADFSHPIYYVPFTVVVNDSSSFTSFDQVNASGNSIAVTTGSNTDELLNSLQQSGKLKTNVIRLKDVGAAVLSLMTAKTTAFASSIDDLSQLVKQQKSLRIVDGSFGTSEYAVSHAKNQEALNAALNETVAAMIKDGSVANLLVKYGVSASAADAQE